MIEVKNITKIYGRGKKRVVALDNVSFVLPDSGMIFVVGKSGCGKSTLLNMIGGCDKLTAGDIVMDGNKFSAFGERDYDNFRNDYVGFVFQDYCLLEGLSVRQNVELALQLKGEQDSSAVDDALAKVGLADCADRRPDELSGGQKQRVAIARTLVKKPKLILADEPTGNLDEKSSAIILDILKELSATALVVIVSHNRPDAERYADRIIELSDGHIVGDLSRNQAAADISFDGQDIVIQKGTVFSDEQLDQMNKRISVGGVRLKQADVKFLPTVTPPITDKSGNGFEPHALSFSGRKTLFAMFAKKRIIGTVFTALCIVFLIVVMGVCQLFTQFDAAAETTRLMQENSSDVFVMRKGYLDANDPTHTVDSSRLYRVTEQDIAALRQTGYEGGIYPLYNLSMITGENSGLFALQKYIPVSDKENYGRLYCRSGLGVLQATEQYLADMYGTDGQLNVLSGAIPTGGVGLVITDYFADSILANNASMRLSPVELAANGDKYAKLTNMQPVLSRYRIAAVIDTGYAERYAPLLEMWQNGQDITTADSDLLARFYNELNEGLNVAYTFNPNFMEDFIADDIPPFSFYGAGLAEIDGKQTLLETGYVYSKQYLKPNEIAVRDSVYCQLVGLSMDEVDWDSIVGKKLKMSFGDLYGDSYNVEGEFTIAELTENTQVSFYVAPQVFRQLKQYCVYPYALYFDDMQGALQLYEKSTDMGYIVQSPLFSAIYTVSKAALVFTDMFELIVGVMLLTIVLMLVAMGVGSVRKNMYEIAVVRALGGKARDLAGIILLQMLIASVAVCILSVLGLALGADLCNSLLGDGFASFANNTLVSKLHIITFNWITALADAALVLVLTVIAAVVPFVIMRRAKPREIIRAKE